MTEQSGSSKPGRTVMPAADKIRALRQRKKWEQLDLASAMRKSLDCVKDLEEGKPVYRGTLQAAAEALGAGYHELLDGADAEPDPLQTVGCKEASKEGQCCTSGSSQKVELKLNEQITNWTPLLKQKVMAAIQEFLEIGYAVEIIPMRD